MFPFQRTFSQRSFSMTRKKLMMPGGSRHAVPVVEAVHCLGVHVLTADYFPNNAAHKASDEYCNVSVVEKETVLESPIHDPKRIGIAMKQHPNILGVTACDAMQTNCLAGRLQ